MNTAIDPSIPAILLVCLVLASPAVASLAILNYDHDPDLAAALEYDRAETTDPSKANRELAEQYYLKYLEKDLPSFQKARVYQRLGAMFTVESDVKHGIVPDRAKGARYLARVLELEPDRIDMATIRARTLLASSGLLSREEYLRRGLDLYGWLLSVDDAKLRKLWLPIEPNQTAIRPIALQSLQNAIPMTRRATAVNVIGVTVQMPDREARLAAIIRRFPGTEIADMARKRLDVQLEEVADKGVQNLESSSNVSPDGSPAGDATSSPHLESPAATATQEGSTPVEPPAAEQSNETGALANTSQISTGTAVRRAVGVIAICVALGGGILFCTIGRKRQSMEPRKP